jgi:hypothetical protein
MRFTRAVNPVTKLQQKAVNIFRYQFYSEVAHSYGFQLVTFESLYYSAPAGLHKLDGEVLF